MDSSHVMWPGLLVGNLKWEPIPICGSQYNKVKVVLPEFVGANKKLADKRHMGARRSHDGQLGANINECEL